MDGHMVPTAFFVTSGVGMDKEQANAFDLALRDAGISECNLVEVSSILPANAEVTERRNVTITPGSITFCVLSRADGKSGEVIGAGVGYGWLGAKTEGGRAQREFGIICEHHGHHAREYLAEKVQEKLQTMATIRDMNILEEALLVESVEVEKGKFGSVVVVLVFVF
ncbi:MAG: pyruvoyl-dependent arginine decarboxylase [Methanomicrobia archaeon]|nr:pyruvoyl-dependent arginine decarboxylase [Methanomicrobia archaeon]